MLVSPYSLIIVFTESVQPGKVYVETWKGYFYSVLMFVATLFNSVLMGQYSINMYRVGANMRAGITTALYSKVIFTTVLYSKVIIPTALYSKVINNHHCSLF